jgi:hypothetical protein
MLALLSSSVVVDVEVKRRLSAPGARESPQTLKSPPNSKETLWFLLPSQGNNPLRPKGGRGARRSSDTGNVVEVMRCAGEAVRDVDHVNVGRPDLYRTGRRDGRAAAAGVIVERQRRAVSNDRRARR